MDGRVFANPQLTLMTMHFQTLHSPAKSNKELLTSNSNDHETVVRAAFTTKLDLIYHLTWW